tara:strand:- start:121271 stop:122086 length:816 start_codon:yes stop_codon:yes gene_type:complete
MKMVKHITLGIVISLIIIGLDYTFRLSKNAEPQKLITTSTIHNIEFVQIPTGEFTIFMPITESVVGLSYIEKDVTFTKPFAISKYEITRKQWQDCTDDGICKNAKRQRSWQTPNHPMTNISWQDAATYAQWLSDKTGENYRLPTEEEWLYVAHEGKPYTPKKFVDEDLLFKQDIRREETKSKGDFGANNWGVHDMNGSTTEWTLSCWRASKGKSLEYVDTAILKDRRECGIRILQGNDRVHLPYFIKNPIGGGCSTGKVPSHVGMRLVKEL